MTDSSRKYLIFLLCISIVLGKVSADSSSYSQSSASAQSFAYSSSNSNSKTPCNCPPLCQKSCPAVYAPVCVSHGTCYQTYENKCLVDKANCESSSDRKLLIVAEGRCEDYPIYSTFLCGCDFACALYVDPVCGFNGRCYKTFSNSCFMANYNCWHPFDNFIYQHDGGCLKGPICPDEQ